MAAVRVTWKYRKRVRCAQRGRVRVGGCHERGYSVADCRHVEREFDALRRLAWRRGHR